MKKQENSRARLIRELVKTTDAELGDEELLHMLITQNLSANPSEKEKPTFGQRAADAVAKFAGSWAFIFSFLLCMALWMLLNVLMAARAFDVYPFILLNLVLSCVAAIQAPLIMMSQNRREAHDRARAENDYRVNLKSELIIGDLHAKLDQVLSNQKKLNIEIEKLRSEQNPAVSQEKKDTV
ncbi:MAG: DUF1003 domain-containing protein [Oscillospiraceae bacterium]|nr:DUF1003 domain-containing protein [Oscillospiraceae bacterium]